MSLKYNIMRVSMNGPHWVLADQIIVSSGSFVTIILAARGMDVAAFGRLSFILLIQLLLLAGQNALISGPFMVVRDEQRRENGYVMALLCMQAMLAVLLLPVALIVYLWHPEWMEGGWWIILLMASSQTQDLLRKVFLSTGRPADAFAIDAVTNILQVLLLAWCYTVRTLDLVRCLAVMSATFLPSIGLGLSRVERSLPSVMYVRAVISRHLHQGKWLLASTLVQWWAGNAFAVSAGVLLSTAAFAALRLAQSLFGVINMLLQAFENHVLPRAADQYGVAVRESRNYILRSARRSALALLPALLIMALAGRPLLLLAGGPSYAGWYRIMPELSLLYLVIFIGYPIRIAVRITKLNKAFFAGYLLSGGFSLLAARPMVQYLGIEGVAAGLLMNQLLMLTYWHTILTKKKFYGDHTCCTGES